MKFQFQQMLKQKNQKSFKSKARKPKTMKNGSGKVSYIGRTSTGSRLVKNSPKNEVRMSRREYITDIIPQAGWSVFKLAINPGDSKSFPWLSGVARNFEKYVINKLTIEYKTGQSSIIPGKIQLGPDFDPSDPSPMSKKELLTYTLACDGPVWQNFSLDIPKGYLMNQKKYYVRSNGQVVNDLKLYDACNVFIGSDANSTELSYLGEIWINYDITLYEPQAPILTNDLQSLGKYYRFNTGVSNNNPFGSGLIPELERGSLDVTLDMPNSAITFNEAWSGCVVQLILENENYGQLPFSGSFYNIQPSGGGAYLGSFDMAVAGSTFEETGNNARMYVGQFKVPIGGTLTWENTGGQEVDGNFTSFALLFLTGGPFIL